MENLWMTVALPPLRHTAGGGSRVATELSCVEGGQRAANGTVTALDPSATGLTLRLTNGLEVPVSRTRRPEVEAASQLLAR